MSDVIFRNEQKSDLGIASEKFLIGVMYEENFGALLPFIRDIEVTDINWNGKDLWIDDVSRGRYCAGIKLDNDFIEAFCIRVANVVSKTFNKYYPRLEAETDDLRITIIHKSVSHTGTTISIRKTPIVKRITFAKSIREDYYCPEEVANLLSNSVKAKFNIVIGGLPGVGKTELVKYLTNYIFPRDRVITIEDTMEIHYSKINPNKDCVELKVDDTVFTYTDAIKSCLRLLPQWILLSEARSKEVQYLLESISTGAKCITTIHTDDMRKVPKRVVNMMGDMDNSALAEQMAYSYFDIGILVDKTQDTATGKISRFIAQIVMYYEHEGENKCIVLYNRGKITGEEIPEEIMQQFNRMGIADPWKYTFIEDTHQEIDDSTGFLDGEGFDDEMSSFDDTTGVTGNSTSRYTDDEDEVSGEVEDDAEVGGVAKAVVAGAAVVGSVLSGVSASDTEGVRESDDQPTGFADEEESEEKSTDYVGEGNDDSEGATDYVESEEKATDYVEEDDSEAATGYVNDEETGFADEDELKQSTEDSDEEGATGIVDDSDESATGVVEDEEAATGVVDESDEDEEATGSVDVDESEAATGYVDASEKPVGKKSGRSRKRGRR